MVGSGKRPNLRIPAPEIDRRLSFERRVLGNLSEQRSEVLLGKPLESVRAWPHRPIVRDLLAP
jgi:hypothetical protein